MNILKCRIALGGTNDIWKIMIIKMLAISIQMLTGKHVMIK